MAPKRNPDGITVISWKPPVNKSKKAPPTPSVNSTEGSALTMNPEQHPRYQVRFQEPRTAPRQAAPTGDLSSFVHTESEVAEGFSGQAMEVETEDLGIIEPSSRIDLTPTSMEPPPAEPPQKLRSVDEHILESLAGLRATTRCGPFNVVQRILDDTTSTYRNYRTEFYKQDNNSLFTLLETILSQREGRQKLRSWLTSPTGLSLVTDVVNDEMDEVLEVERMSLSTITPDFVRDWEVCSHEARAPFLFSTLMAASQTARAKEENKRKKPDTVCRVVVKQLAYQRSGSSLGFPAQIGLYLWSSGASRQAIDAIHRCALSISYTSVRNLMKHLAACAVREAIEVSRQPHMLGYDNINLSTSIFVEQRGSSGPAKVTSGTFGILYPIPNVNPDHLRISPIMEKFRSLPPSPLEFERDIRPSKDLLDIVNSNFAKQIVRVLTKHVSGFHTFRKHPQLQPTPRRRIALKPRSTRQYPLPVTQTEEATVAGNLLFQDQIYTGTLQRTPESLSNTAIPCIGDQLTNSRNRTIKLQRAQDVNAWETREVLQSNMGHLHTGLNYSWTTFNSHRGSLDQTGSLTYFFRLLDKTRLNKEHPDYHTLVAALEQVFEGAVLSYWTLTCDKNSLNAYAKSSPTAEDLLNKAEEILFDHITPLPSSTASELKKLKAERHEAVVDTTQELNKSKKSSKQPAQVLPITGPGPDELDPDDDVVNQNLRLLLRDILVLVELLSAIRDGDIGRIEDLFPFLIMMFRGAGGTNYSNELLWLVLNLKHVWPPEFADIMRDTSLINTHGSPIPVDTNIELAIGKLKKLLVAKGLDHTWDLLGDASAAINSLEDVKTQVAKELNLSYQSRSHCAVDTSHLVWRVAKHISQEKLNMHTPNREGNDTQIPTPDILEVGMAKLRSSSLATFNKQVYTMVQAYQYAAPTDANSDLPDFAAEVDTLPPNPLTIEKPIDDVLESELLELVP